MINRVAIGIPCLLRGGTEMQTLQLVKALTGLVSTCGGGQERASKGPTSEVEVVCYFESDPGVVGEFYAAGAKVNLLNLDRTISPWAFVQTATKVFRNARADIIHIQYMAPGFLAVVAARLSSTGSVIATVHHPWTRKNHGYPAKVLLRSAAILCRRFTCVSRAAERSWFGSSGILTPDTPGAPSSATRPRRHMTIHNAVDITEVDRILGDCDTLVLRRSLGVEGCVVVGAVARLSHIKGIDLLLEAFARVKNQLRHGSLKRSRDVGEPRQGLAHGRIVLVVVGDGEETVRLQGQVSNLGLTGRDLRGAVLDGQPDREAGEHDVLWLGRRSWEESIKVMSTFDICVVPSRFEGFGLTAAEAMVCGKQVLAADEGGLPEVVGRDGLAGVLFPTENIRELTTALLDLINSENKRHRVGTEARRRAVRRFGLDRLRESVWEIYGEAHTP